MKLRRTCALAPVAMLLPLTDAVALEKTSVSMLGLEHPDAWQAATNTVTMQYYNVCTGWTWAWSNWQDGEQVGVVAREGWLHCAYQLTTWSLVMSPAPSGYGFTGTMSLHAGSDCTSPVLSSQPYLPSHGWNSTSWDVGYALSDPMLLRIEWSAPGGFTNPARLLSDHPAAGATGPQACGTCYPSTRVSHSVHFGVDGTYCPGIGLSDGVCDVEFLMEFAADLAIDCPVSVQSTTWGAIKALYR